MKFLLLVIFVPSVAFADDPGAHLPKSMVFRGYDVDHYLSQPPNVIRYHDSTASSISEPPPSPSGSSPSSIASPVPVKLSPGMWTDAERGEVEK